MAMMPQRKLVVEVISARDLMPKDGQGSSNSYCVVCSRVAATVCFQCSLGNRHIDRVAGNA
jgi:hypothetical protein